VTRLVVAQAALAAAIGLLYSRRHLPSILITLMLVAALWGLALVVRSGTQAAWIFAIGFEAAFILFGLFRFFTSRYLGGTLFAIIALAALLHPAVARAFNTPVWRARQGHGQPGLAETADGAL
jgi:ribose/xylose/arabinose/galactoside ABC-type transport system permease subunit